MLQLAIANDLFDLRWQQLLALLFAHLNHLVAEHDHAHLRLQFAVSTGTAIVSDQSERLDQVL